MYSNKRRSHIHIIRQYDVNTNKYLGIRIVLFKKKGNKKIYDLDNFREHLYKNSKLKNNESSAWSIKESNLKDIIKKTMINKSLDGKYKMIHILYESDKVPLQKFIKNVLELENIEFKNNIYNF